MEAKLYWNDADSAQSTPRKRPFGALRAANPEMALIAEDLEAEREFNDVSICRQ